MWLSFTVSDQASAANKQIRNDIYWSAGKQEIKHLPLQKEQHHGVTVNPLSTGWNTKTVGLDGVAAATGFLSK